MGRYNDRLIAAINAFDEMEQVALRAESDTTEFNEHQFVFQLGALLTRGASEAVGVDHDRLAVLDEALVALKPVGSRAGEPIEIQRPGSPELLAVQQGLQILTQAFETLSRSPLSMQEHNCQ